MLLNPTLKKYIALPILVLGIHSHNVNADANPDSLRCDMQVETCFSYTHVCNAKLVELIQSARHRILLAAYSFTSHPIAEAIKEAHLRGVKIHVVLDASNEFSRHSKAPELIAAGIDVRTNHRYAIMHHKFLVVDNAVGFGSMNFTYGGDRKNAENFNIFRQVPSLVKQYRNEFLRLYAESQPYVSRIKDKQK